MSHAPGFAHSTQSVPGPTPTANWMHLDGSPSFVHLDWNHVPQNNTDQVLENGSAYRTDRRRHRSQLSSNRTSDSLRTVNRIRNGGHQTRTIVAPPVTKSCQGNGLTLPEFEFCRQSLRSAFQKCTDIEFLRLSVVISSLLNCFGSLRVADISAILTLIFGAQFGSPNRSHQSEGNHLQSLRLKCSQIFFEDSTGVLRFAHPLISKFLLACPIKGIDRSHVILTKACLTQVELSGGLYRSESIRVCQPESKATPFLPYAAAHWQNHYRHAEKQNSSLTGRVHRLLWSAITRGGLRTDDDRERGLAKRWEAINEALLFCTENRLQVLSTAYTQTLVAVDATLAVSDREEAVSESDLREAKASEFDQAFAQLGIGDYKSDLDHQTRV